MHDIRAIRENPEAFDAGLKRRGLAGEFSAKRILDLDEQRRAHVTKLQEAQARRNAASKEIGAAKKAKDDAKANALMAEVAALKDLLASGEEKEKALTAEVEAMLAVIPNLPLAEVPDGTDEKGNVEVRRAGEPPKLAGINKPLQHFEIGERLGMMDFESAAKISGARFVFLKGQLARLERALAQFMLDIHTEEFGYLEVVPPLLVRDAAAYGTGNLPKFEDDLFQTGRSLSEVMNAYFGAGVLSARLISNANPGLTKFFEGSDNVSDFSDAIAAIKQGDIASAIRGSLHFVRSDDRLWLIPTAEVSLTNLVREQILEEEALPKRFTAWTPCFRSEAGAAGKDTRGMIRQHQFSKVELVSVTTPEKSLEEHERMTNCAETILKRLGLSFRTMLLCTGDMGFASQKTYDIEVWLPGQDTFREISSCSVCGDFQARRMGARYRPKGSKEVKFVHTLNGSGLAVGRTMVAILENYQQADGSVAIPDVLKPYMGGRDRIAKA